MDKPVRDRQGIAGVFADYYVHLYSLTQKATVDECSKLLADICMLELSQDNREALRVAEIVQTIRNLATGKTMGPNGLPVELYKLSSESSAPSLLRMFLESQETGQLPHDQRQESIVVIPKENKPPEDCASYRPLSLLNAKVKILAKLLATRLVGVIRSLIHLD
ncbi:hypothetical protein NDU88_002325 [Pleurodeles waltl]|uniref:Reverse transcriptase n=1 Tax=Pleurodeles waltl TaxID=8319 RepID=A0AAV7TKS5_PLEWA|nr:hypothetical protein NDU88_002325 [Pleurodeles waltl]